MKITFPNGTIVEEDNAEIIKELWGKDISLEATPVKRSKKHSHKKYKKIVKYCKQCGKGMYVKKYDYCSDECRKEHKREYDRIRLIKKKNHVSN